jgi:hypothetical protein
MKRVILESPYAGDVASNEAYLRACMKDSLARGEAPFAGHGFYTQVLDDTKPDERSQGMRASYQWSLCAQLVAVYCDRGLSPGMAEGINFAIGAQIPVEFRWIERDRL